MTSLDWILAAVLVWSVGSGLMAGFARVCVGIAAGLLAVLLSFWYYRIPASWLNDFFESKPAANAIGFLLIFFAILIAGGLVGRAMAAIFKWAGLTWLDRMLGAGFGLLRGMLIVAGLVAVLMAFAPNPPPRWVSRSSILPYVSDFSRVVAAVAPQELKNKFDENLDRVRGIWARRGELAGNGDRKEPGTDKPEELKTQTY